MWFTGNGSSPAQNSTRSISPNNSTTNSQFSLQHNSSGSLGGGVGGIINGNGIAGGVGGSGGSGLGSPNGVGGGGGGGSCTPTSLQPQVSRVTPSSSPPHRTQLNCNYSSHICSPRWRHSNSHPLYWTATDHYWMPTCPAVYPRPVRPIPKQRYVRYSLNPIDMFALISSLICRTIRTLWSLWWRCIPLRP